MNKTSQSYEAGLKEDLRDPEEAAAYLKAAVEDGSMDVFLLTLRDIVVARLHLPASSPASGFPSR